MTRLIFYLTLVFIPFPSFASDDPFETQAGIQNIPVDEICSQEIIGKKLILADVITYALCNNPVTRQSYMNAFAVASQYGQAKADYMPTVDFSAGLSQSDSDLKINTDRNSSNARASLSLEWLLYDFGGRRAFVERTKQALNIALFSRADILQSLIFEVTQAYYVLLAAQEELKNSALTLDSSFSAYEAASKRYELGLVALSDKLQAETSYSQAQLTVAKAEEAVALAKGRLAVLLNYPPYISVLLEPAVYDQQIADFDSQIEDLLEVALEKRADIIAKKAELKQSLADIEIEKAKNKPSFALSGGFDLNDELTKGGEKERSTRIGVTMTVPLFTGFKNTYKITQARYLSEKTSAELRQLENTVQTDVWDSFQSYHTAKKTHEISQTLLRSALQNEQVALGAYKAGKGSMLNLLDAQSKLADARTSKSRTFYQMLIAKSNLIRSMGLIDPFKPKKGF